MPPSSAPAAPYPPPFPPSPPYPLFLLGEYKYQPTKYDQARLDVSEEAAASIKVQSGDRLLTDGRTD